MKNDRTKLLIIGNSTAAVGAVEGIRKVDRRSPIVLISKEPYHTYSRPLISYLLAGEVDDQRMYYRPDDFYQRNNVDARLEVEALAVDPDKRIVRTADGGRINFEKLLIATGGKPFVPEIEGLGHAEKGTRLNLCEAPSGPFRQIKPGPFFDAKGLPIKGVFTFTSWDDAKAVGSYIKERGARKAVVIGGGLIGIKSAEALHAQGLEVLMVELAQRLLPLALDQQAASLAAGRLLNAGVELECDTTVDKILSEQGCVSGVVLKTGREVICDLVIVAIGVLPNVDIVRGTAIETDRGILIDEHCQTNIQSIHAAGDVTQSRDALTGQSRPIPIFPNAFRQGNVAGTNMAGGLARAGAAFAMNSVEVFGLPTISVGLATASGDQYEVLTRADDEAGTYRRIVLKNGCVVGALFVGDIDRAGIFTGLIRQRVQVSGIKDLLLSDEFGLISLPAEYRKHVVKGEGIEV